ncbi:unnamed protein product [Phytomonas sp. EM1]|nr:unnamed protein product [Phytomonas sp. EM1]|eukprot:CCW64041.1 unnamed protein product [Phytomonas sp. isolate EM1]
MRNGDYTAFTITQSAAYGGAGGDMTIVETERRRAQVSEAVKRINQAYEKSQAAFNVAVSNLQTNSLRSNVQSATVADTTSTPKTVPSQTTYERLMADIAKMRMSANRLKRRGASATAAPTQRRAYSNSHNGGYLLERYGGDFPREKFYHHYRYHGLESQHKGLTK